MCMTTRPGLIPSEGTDSGAVSALFPSGGSDGLTVLLDRALQHVAFHPQVESQHRPFPWGRFDREAVAADPPLPDFEQHLSLPPARPVILPSDCSRAKYAGIWPPPVSRAISVVMVPHHAPVTSAAASTAVKRTRVDESHVETAPFGTLDTGSRKRRADGYRSIVLWAPGGR